MRSSHLPIGYLSTCVRSSFSNWLLEHLREIFSSSNGVLEHLCKIISFSNRVLEHLCEIFSSSNRVLELLCEIFSFSSEVHECLTVHLYCVQYFFGLCSCIIFFGDASRNVDLLLFEIKLYINKKQTKLCMYFS